MPNIVDEQSKILDSSKFYKKET